MSIDRIKVDAFLELVAYGSRILDVLITNIRESDNNVDNLLKTLLKLQSLIKDAYWAYKFMVPEDNFNQIMQLFWIDCDNELIQNTAINVVQFLCISLQAQF